MKSKLFYLLLVFAVMSSGVLPVAAQPVDFAALRPTPQQEDAARLSAEILERYHYGSVSFDSALSERIFVNYLRALDAEKSIFQQSDIDAWTDARAKFGDVFQHGDLTMPFAIFNRYRERAVERLTDARTMLKQGVDFTINEDYQYQRDQAPWPHSAAEMHDLWRRRVKNDWLELRLAGKDDPSIVDILDRRYDNYLKRLLLYKSEDAFQIFMEAAVSAVDPHSGYMGPRATEEFDIAMRLSLVGIGAVLEDKDGRTTIKELVPGGPAAVSGKLEPGDRILGVAQGEKGAMVDVIGWRLDDTVALIRGTADSVVVLDVLPAGAAPDATHHQVTLVRKKINLEAQAAKKSILTFADKGVTHRIGVISLPAFYEDFEAKRNGDAGYRSASRDVGHLLTDLKAEHVDGVLIDLRNDGGGSLAEAIALTGLFIDTGPVVQQRDARGAVTVSSDTTPGVAWSGPLGVLINRGSASASEIFAAAMQDYHRGIIVGETSFGKGTVQTVVDLDEFAERRGVGFGDIRLTVAQFFRVNGQSTQLIGVTPDLTLPTLTDAEHFGEANFDNALPSTQIRPAQYVAAAPFGNMMQALRARHEARLNADPNFKNLRNDIAEIDRRRKRNAVSLLETARRAERAKLEKLLAAPVETSAAPEDPDRTVDDATTVGDRKSDKDFFLTEASHVVSDEVDLLSAQTHRGGAPTSEAGAGARVSSTR